MNGEPFVKVSAMLIGDLERRGTAGVNADRLCKLPEAKVTPEARMTTDRSRAFGIPDRAGAWLLP
ncbi:hypothetical protein [Sphingopyxis fribergensis]